MSQLIHLAVWLTFCRGLPLAGSEFHGNLYFFMFYKPGSFFYQRFIFEQYSLLWDEKQTLTGFFWYKKKKKLKRTGVSSTCLAATVIGHFSGILRIHSSSISAYSWRLKENTSFSESKKTFVIHCLSIYYCSSTGERAEYISGDEKDQFDVVMQTSSNTQ